MEASQFLWIIIISIRLLVGVNVEVKDTRNFKLIKSDKARMIPLKSDAQSKTYTLAQCAAKCRERWEECLSFVYNKDDQECYLGSWSVPRGYTFIQECDGRQQVDNLDKIKGSLYSFGCCTDKYILRTMDRQVSKCVRYISSRLIFEQAQEECEKDKAQLITFKTNDEYDFVRWLLGCKEDTWVGMRTNCHETGIDCNVNERKLFWVDKVEVSDSMVKKLSPDINNNNDEHCLEIARKYGTFNDDQCDEKFYFACERNPQKHQYFCQ